MEIDLKVKSCVRGYLVDVLVTIFVVTGMPRPSTSVSTGLSSDMSSGFHGDSTLRRCLNARSVLIVPVSACYCIG